MGGISVWQLLIVLAIVALLFGTKKVRSIAQIWARRFEAFVMPPKTTPQMTTNHRTTTPLRGNHTCLESRCGNWRPSSS